MGAIVTELGQSEKGLDLMIAMVSGDQLTIRNLILGLYQLQDGTNAQERLDFLEPVIGLFHLQMNVLGVLIQNFWGPMLQRYSVLFKETKVNAPTAAKKDFRATNFFINDVLDGTILAAVASHPDVDVASGEELKAYIGKYAELKLANAKASIQKESQTKKTRATQQKPSKSAASKKPIDIEVKPAFNLEKTIELILRPVFDISQVQRMRYNDDDSKIPAKGEPINTPVAESISMEIEEEHTESDSEPEAGAGNDEQQFAPRGMHGLRTDRRARVEEEDEYAKAREQVETFVEEGDSAETGRNQANWRSRDLIFENNVLFLRDALVYREYEDAVSSGDTGRIERVLKYWTVMYQGTQLANYPQEMIHLMACLLKVWGEDLRNLWLDNCLVNMMGRKGAYLPLDLFCEYVVRELKKRKNPTSNLISGAYWERTLARQIMVMLASRQGIYHGTRIKPGAIGQRTAKMDSSSHAIIVCSDILNAGGFKYKENGRCVPSENCAVQG